jgi:hypothetical protein
VPVTAPPSESIADRPAGFSDRNGRTVVYQVATIAPSSPVRGRSSPAVEITDGLKDGDKIVSKVDDRSQPGKSRKKTK